jgi:hypothetical protein
MPLLSRALPSKIGGQYGDTWSCGITSVGSWLGLVNGRCIQERRSTLGGFDLFLLVDRGIDILLCQKGWLDAIGSHDPRYDPDDRWRQFLCLDVILKLTADN